MNRNINRDPSRADHPPTLTDILFLQAIVEGVAGRNPGDVDEQVRVVANYYPNGRTDLGPEGRVISEVLLSQRVGGTGIYETVMNYRVIRDGDETTTKILKKPPFSVPTFDETFGDLDPLSDAGSEAHSRAIAGMDEDLALHGLARQAGMDEITARETWELGNALELAYPDAAGVTQRGGTPPAQ
jgi:hypothetical protein